jgi:hypothetical protein
MAPASVCPSERLVRGRRRGCHAEHPDDLFRIAALAALPVFRRRLMPPPSDRTPDPVRLLRGMDDVRAVSFRAFFVKINGERELEIRFGDSFREYKSGTPMLIPRRPRA